MVSMATASKPNTKGTQKREATNRPVNEIRLGRVRAAIWANTTDTGVRHNVTISRLYKDEKSGEWRDSASFGRDDMPLVAKVCDLAHTWIYENSGNGGDSK
jgi:hypothetical protein